MNQSYTGTISGTSIAINLPYGKTTNAIPTITTNAVTILAGGTAFTSGVTPVDFTSPVIFTLTSSTGVIATYTVTAYLLAPVEDTGQLSCHDNSAIQTCASVSGTFPGQDAAYSNIPNAKGLQLPTTNSGYSSDYVTKNTLTGIVWKTCMEGLSGPTCATGGVSSQDYTTASSTCSALNSANAGAGFAGLKNWRLPVIQELTQAQFYNTSSVYWDSTFFPGTANNPDLHAI